MNNRQILDSRRNAILVAFKFVSLLLSALCKHPFIARWDPLVDSLPIKFCQILTLWNVLVSGCAGIVCAVDIAPVPTSGKWQQVHGLMRARLGPKIAKYKVHHQGFTQNAFISVDVQKQCNLKRSVSSWFKISALYDAIHRRYIKWAVMT